MSGLDRPSETLPVEWVERETLMPNDWNPNTMSEDKREELVYSILDSGYTQPLVVDPTDDTIIDGEQRWHATRDARIRTDEALTPDGVPAGYVPVFYLDVDETQTRIATLQHNASGEMDAEDLGSLFADLDEAGMFYDVAERLQLGETGIDRLIERATSDTDTPSAFTSDDADTADPEDEHEAFTESMGFQMTREEYELVDSLLSEMDLTTLCDWAVESNVHSQTRVDMRQLSERHVVYRYGEEPIEYPDVEIERHLRSFMRPDDPEVDDA